MAYRNDYPVAYNLITGPASEPFTAATLDTSTYLKDIDAATESVLFETYLIPTARRLAEKTMNRKLFTQTWEVVFDSQPNVIRLPFGQLQSITSIKTVADDETETTETSTNYTVETGDAGCVFLKQGYTWTTTTRAYRMFKVRFVCGWDAIASIPITIKSGIMAIIAYLYDNRQDIRGALVVAENVLCSDILMRL